MADVEWIENIKKIVLQAVDAGDPCDIVTGTVTSTAPLNIQIDQKTILSSAQLLVPERMTDYRVDMTIPGVGNSTVTVRSSLKTGQRVLLLQKRGGQLYAVLDRW